MKKGILLFALLALVLGASLGVAMAGTQADGSDAKAILKFMSDYVAGQKTIQLTFDSDIEVITPQLEKIQFTNSGDALLNRPDKLRAHRVGGYAEVEVDDKPIPRKLVITSKTVNNAPQYTLRVKEWITGVDPGPVAFTFVPPAGFQKLSHDALIALDELPQGEQEGGKP